MDEIHDIHGLRLIVKNEEDCQRALRIVHHLWSEVPGRCKDYISHPKFNGYVVAQEMAAFPVFFFCFLSISLSRSTSNLSGRFEGIDLYTRS